MADNQDKQIRNIRAGLLAAGFTALAVMGFQLKGAISEMLTVMDEYDQAVKEIKQDLGKAQTDLSQDMIAASSELEAGAKYLNLCNNLNFWWDTTLPCELIELSDGTIIDIEENSASQRIIETIDGLQSGEIESVIGESLPIEESDPMLLYEFTI